MKKPVYLHGYSKKEQKRLIHQAHFLKEAVYRGIDLKKCHHLLEVGCGVGAQTQILIEKFPHLKITGIDISEVQLALARKRLSHAVKQGQVEFVQSDAKEMSLAKKKYDAAFLCWLLEHVPDPLSVLKKTRSQLKSSGEIICTEVQNATFFVDPYSPSILKYWFALNDFQWSAKGHPFVGAQLGNLLKRAGYKDIQLEVRPFFYDSREPKMRRKYIEYFSDLLLSASDNLLQNKRITRKELLQVKRELKTLAQSRDSVLFYAFVRATARA